MRIWLYEEENMFQFLKARVNNMLRLKKDDTNYIYPASPFYGFNILHYLKFILEQLLKFAPQDIDLTTLKEQYINDILRALAFKIIRDDFGFGNRLPLDGSLIVTHAYTHVHSPEDLLQRDINGQIYTAAAAVGNTTALEASIYSCYPHGCMPMSMLQDCPLDWNFPLELAALNNQVDVVKDFLDRHVSHAILNHDTEYLNLFVCFIAKDPLQTATSRGNVGVAKLLIDFLADHYDSTDLKLAFEHTELYEFRSHGWAGTIDGLVGFPAQQGSIEIFKHAHSRFRKIQSVYYYISMFSRGFNEACKRGHADFIRYIIHSGHIASLKDDESQWVHDPSWPNPHPVLTAVAYSQISALQALFTEETYSVHHPDLLRTAIYGEDWLPSEGSPTYAPGIRYPVTRFLIENGLPIDRDSISVANGYAKFCLTVKGEYLPKHTPIRLSADLSATFLLLIEALKKQSRSAWLRKQLWVPVRKVIELIVKTGLDLPDGYTMTAKILLKWIEGR